MQVITSKSAIVTLCFLFNAVLEYDDGIVTEKDTKKRISGTMHNLSADDAKAVLDSLELIHTSFVNLWLANLVSEYRYTFFCQLYDSIKSFLDL